MSDLDVRLVQKALREHAEKGHDVISRPGATTISGHHFPFVIANSLHLETSEREPSVTDSSLITHIPLNESGNTIGHYSWAGNYGPKWDMFPQAETPLVYKSPRGIIHAYQGAYLGEHNYETDLNLLDKQGDIGEYYKEAQKLKSYTETRNSFYGETVPKHDLHEAAWNSTFDFHGNPHERYIPKPSNLQFNDIRHLIGITHHTKGHWHERAQYLYHPESEKLIRF